MSQRCSGLRPRGWLQRFHRDQTGTTMTEFVIALPVLIMIFVGTYRLGLISDRAVKVHGRGHAEIFDAYYVAQQVSASELFDEMSRPLGDREGSHMLPTTGGVSAAYQLSEYPIPQESSVVRGAILAIEAPTYMGLASGGHLGESANRLAPLTDGVGFMPPGIGAGAITSDTQRTMGNAGHGGSRLGANLIFDGPSGYQPSDSNCERGLGQLLTGSVNDMLSVVGMRPMLAAGMQYGTISTEHVYTESLGPLGQVEMRANYNIAVPPRVLDTPDLQPLLTVMVSRLALSDCNLAPYSNLLYIEKASQTLPSATSWGLDGVPDPSAVPLREPLTYGGSGP